MEELIMSGDDRYYSAGPPGITFYGGIRHSDHATPEQRNKHADSLVGEIQILMEQNDILAVVSKASDAKLIINIPDNQHVRKAKKVLSEGALLEYVEVQPTMKLL